MSIRRQLALGALLGAAAAACGDGGTTPNITSPFASLTTGSLHSCGVTQAGNIYCWGWNRDGQLGDGSTSDRSQPALVMAGGQRFATVTAGGGHTCALADDRRAFCWGFNLNGQLGKGSPGGTSTPAPVSGGLLFDVLDVGGSFSCGIAASGGAYCWGWNGVGQLGDGTTTDRFDPVPVGGPVLVTIAVGAFHACGLTAAGAAYCWGDNERGQLGTGDLVSSSTPVAVAGGHVFTSLVVGFRHACGVTTDGDIRCWGANEFGQLGDATLADRHQPVTVAPGATLVGVSAGSGNFTCGLAAGGEAYCWGFNNSGQLGARVDQICTDPGSQLGVACSSTPVAVSGGLTFATISAGAQHTCGVTVSGVAYCWGLGNFGQLGDGTSGDNVLSVEPVRVAGQP